MWGKKAHWPKRCGCGRTWTWLAWQTLPWVGLSHLARAPREMRNCSCGSTLSVPAPLDRLLQERATAACNVSRLLRVRCERIRSLAQELRRA